MEEKVDEKRFRETDQERIFCSWHKILRLGVILGVKSDHNHKPKSRLLTSVQQLTFLVAHLVAVGWMTRVQTFKESLTFLISHRL